MERKFCLAFVGMFILCSVILLENVSCFQPIEEVDLNAAVNQTSAELELQLELTRQRLTEWWKSILKTRELEEKRANNSKDVNIESKTEGRKKDATTFKPSGNWPSSDAIDPGQVEQFTFTPDCNHTNATWNDEDGDLVEQSTVTTNCNHANALEEQSTVTTNWNHTNALEEQSTVTTNWNDSNESWNHSNEALASSGSLVLSRRINMRLFYAVLFLAIRFNPRE